MALGLVAIVVASAWSIAAAGASPATIPIDLGKHEFGHLSHPEAIVAIARAGDVGWDNPPGGSQNGPWSFDVGADGSAWLLDQNNNRLLVWNAGDPGHIARTVPLPTDVIRVAADIAVGSDGTVYLSFLPWSDADKTLHICALSRSGTLRWESDTDIEYLNDHVRIGPDGALYWTGGEHRTWTQVTNPQGDPLSLQQQREHTSPYQPMPDGHRLEARNVGHGDVLEWRYSLLDRTGTVVRAWLVTSDDELGGTVDTPGVSGGDPVVTVGVSRQNHDGFLYEYVALRLPAPGAPLVQLALDPGAVWGDVPITGVRVGPDGDLYQLRSDIKTGVTIAAYTLRAAPPPTTPSPSSSATATASPSSSSSASPTASSPARTVAPAPTPVTSAVEAPSASPVDSTSPSDVILPVALIVLALGGLGGVLWWWRRSSRTPGSGPAEPPPSPGEGGTAAPGG